MNEHLEFKPLDIETFKQFKNIHQWMGTATGSLSRVAIENNMYDFDINLGLLEDEEEQNEPCLALMIYYAEDGEFLKEDTPSALGVVSLHYLEKMTVKEFQEFFEGLSKELISDLLIGSTNDKLAH